MTMKEKYKILAQYIKDISGETNDVETYLFVKDNISSKLLLICTPKLSGFSIVFMTSTAVTMLVANNYCFQPA